MKDPRCKVPVGIHPGPFWINRIDGLAVCDRHRRQFEERTDEFGPFDWAPQDCSYGPPVPKGIPTSGGTLKDRRAELYDEVRKRRGREDADAISDLAAKIGYVPDDKAYAWAERKYDEVKANKEAGTGYDPDDEHRWLEY
jgi:hypothetical protein